jgi:glycosyltransferase involved in cell wall biosynthesis
LEFGSSQNLSINQEKLYTMTKKALVADWYYTNGGAEKVVHSMNNIWNDFDHYALIDFLPEKDRKYVFSGNSDKVKTSFIQNLPTAGSNHRKFLGLFPRAIEQFDLADYDLIVSSSASVAKGVLTHANQVHVSYMHSPMRYAWDLYFQYLREAKMTGVKSWYATKVLHKIRLWDVISTNRVDHLVANSNYIAKRIKKIYRRDATVIYPPVDIANFSLECNKENYYLTASRMVPYKKMDLIVEAFSIMPHKKLLVIGDGPELRKIKLKATSNIEFLGNVSLEKMIIYMQKAKAFVFAAEEDFGIVPVEAQACGTPVLAYAKGGALETVLQGVSGSFFQEQTTASIIEGVKKMDQIDFKYDLVRKNAERFRKERFETEFKDFVDSRLH